MKARLASLLVLALFVTPLAVGAQNIPVPTPAPTVAPKMTPLPYPAYGPQAPDVELLIPHKGVPPHVSVEQAIAIAVAIAPTFVSERAAYSEIRAAYGEAKQKVFPTISASGTWQQNTSVQVAPGCYDPTTCGRRKYTITDENGSYTISQLIFDGGAVITAIKEAKETDIAGRYTLLYQLDTLAYDVANAYYTVLEDKALVDADEQLVREFEVEENAVRAEIRNGTSALSALAQQEYETAEARGELVTAQGNAISAQATFATMLGFDANAQIVPEPLGRDEYTATPTYAKSLEQALLLRPDYLSAQHTVMSDRDALRYAELARVPTITGTFTGETSREFPPVAAPFGSNGYWTPSETLGASISLPIYDQGTIWYNIEAAKYNLQEAQANLASTKLTVESDVRSALAQLFSARASFVEDQKGLSAAQVSMQAAQASYKVGVDTILDLVTAEANLAAAQSTYVTALYGVRVAEQNYLYQLGVSDLRL